MLLSIVTQGDCIIFSILIGFVLVAMAYQITDPELLDSKQLTWYLVQYDVWLKRRKETTAHTHVQG